MFKSRCHIVIVKENGLNLTENNLKQNNVNIQILDLLSYIIISLFYHKLCLHFAIGQIDFRLHNCWHFKQSIPIVLFELASGPTVAYSLLCLY